MEIHTYKPEDTQAIVDAVPPSPRAPAPIAPPPQPVPPMQKPPRRVGTFTLGVTLVLLGILVPLALMLGGKAWRMLLLAPVVLLCLGVEILVYAVRFKSDRFRYDGLSIFMVVAITFVTLLGSLVAPVAANAADYADKSYQARHTLTRQLEEAVAASGAAGDIHVYESYGNYEWAYFFRGVDEETPLRMTAQVRLSTLGGSDTDVRVRVETVFAALAAAAGRAGNADELYLRYQEETEKAVVYYSADIYGAEAIRGVDKTEIHNRLQVEEHSKQTKETTVTTLPASPPSSSETTPTVSPAAGRGSAEREWMPAFERILRAVMAK